MYQRDMRITGSRILLLTLLLLIPTVMTGRDRGLFNISQNDRGCHVEIPKSILGRDFILAARVMSVSSPNNKVKLYAGQRLYDPVWVRFRHDGDYLYLLRPDSKNICGDTAHASYTAYAANAVTPISEVWKVEHETDSTIMVDWARFFSDPIDGADPFGGKTAPGKPISQLTKILGVKSGENNLEVSVQYGFEGSVRPFLTTVRKSLLLLPEYPMQPRVYDARVGYDNIPKKKFDIEGPSIKDEDYITRFRIVPSPEDRRDYQRGKKVRPLQPIVFYIDDAFPELWQRAIRKGILDWNKAFEKIGFKDVMQAKMYSEGGPGFDPNDIRFNCFRYVISEFPNAMGKHWVDPRSGEILQADVLFHSNVLTLLRKWYFLQTSAYNKTAREKTLPDDVTEQLIRYAAAHEIGHCLGLEHNFKASYAYDTDDLRKPEFARLNGTTPSIMDYARFNYVAQPGDNVDYVLPPVLGVYDIYAIRIGYEYLAVEDEKTVSGWIDQGQKDPRCRYEKMRKGTIPVEPSVQQSDLGNDPVASATYGIDNLRVILKRLPEWYAGHRSDNPFDGMPATYEDLRHAYFGHLEHVVPFIGQPGDISEKSVGFLLKQLLDGYAFLLADDVCRYAGDQTEAIVKAQKSITDGMYSRMIAERIVSGESKTGFSYERYLDMSASYLFAGSDPDIFTRNLQESYLKALKTLLAEADTSTYGVLFAPVIRDHLTDLDGLLAGNSSSWNNYIRNKYLQ